MTNINTETNTTRTMPGGRSSPMNPIQRHANVQYRIDSLLAAADAERLAALQRQVHVEEHAVHPSLGHSHAPTGIRRMLGHALIGLGSAIAGASPDAGARRAA